MTRRSRVRISEWQRRFFSSPKCPDWFWSPLSLLFNWCQNSFPAVMLITHLHPAPRLRMNGATPLVALHAVMAWTGKTAFTFAFIRTGYFSRKWISWKVCLILVPVLGESEGVWRWTAQKWDGHILRLTLRKVSSCRPHVFFIPFTSTDSSNNSWI
jgi:hypothetical protein